MPSLSDVRDREARSRNMAAIRGKDTKPEMVVRKGLYARGLRYRLHAKKLPGKPDLVFPSLKTALFVNGCFWHAHEGCRYFKVPKTDTERWLSKFEENRSRDRRNCSLLRELGWRVIIVWECSLRGRKQLEIDCFLDGLFDDIIASVRNE